MSSAIDGIVERIRAHPRIAGATAISVLGLFLRYVLGEIIWEKLGDLLFDAVGEWLGVSDVHTLTYVLSYLIPFGVSAFILVLVYRAGFAARNGGVGLPTITREPPKSLQLQEEPNWSLSELFSHIDPDVLDDKRWLSVGQGVRDALGLGRLKSWGRIWLKDGPMADPQQWPTPQEIPASYWRFGTFTYTFFNPTRDSREPDTNPGHGTSEPTYFDVRVNETRAKQFWPQAAPDNHYIDLKEAAIQAYEACRHQLSGKLSETMAEGDENSVVTWYCWSLWERIPIFGAHPPSRKIEQIDRGLKNSCTFKVKNGALTLENRYRYGSDRYTNLKVLVDALPKAIASMKTRDKEIEASWDQ